MLLCFPAQNKILSPYSMPQDRLSLTVTMTASKPYHHGSRHGKTYQHHLYARVAHIMGITTRAVRKTVSSSSMSCPSTQDTSVEAIRCLIHGRFAANYCHITVGGITKELVMANIIPEETSEMSVWHLITPIGFHYKTSQWKIEWVDTTQDVTSITYSRQVPLGEGERFVPVAAGRTNGFVEDSFFCYPAKNTSGDYQGKMNSELFLRWLTTQLVPSLPEPSVLVLDYAPYHSLLTEESQCPTIATRKADFISWLEPHRIPIPPGATRPKLLLLYKQNRPEPQYVVDKVNHDCGHEVVHLPSGHLELNAKSCQE
ncbi:hypothetical protein E2C01_052234 [Portunus trituberculatus]|uniref:Uncharacterized protein n=1 Tax=Portunus trituberculatus TaxID=210409 RepID=A0A5B7GMG4_PORTR|nr:hypothetical protein [Portunus trituberculatus]